MHVATNFIRCVCSLLATDLISKKKTLSLSITKLSDSNFRPSQADFGVLEGDPAHPFGRFARGRSVRGWMMAFLLLRKGMNATYGHCGARREREGGIS